MSATTPVVPASWETEVGINTFRFSPHTVRSHVVRTRLAFEQGTLCALLGIHIRKHVVCVASPETLTCQSIPTHTWATVTW